MTKERLINYFFERNYMITPNLFKKIPDDFDYENFIKKTNLQKAGSIMSLSEEMFDSFLYKSNININNEIVTKVEIIDPYVDKPKKREVKDFVLYMKARYHALKTILLQRTELSTVVSISKVYSKKPKDAVAIIGLIYKIDKTKNGTYIIELEDPTGIIKIIINAKNEELINIIEELILDEVIGIIGTVAENAIYANKIIFPDLPLKEYKKCRDDVSVVFLSDLHIGSNLFAKEEFERFIDWLNLNFGSEEQKEYAAKVKYLIISGDLIDGVGIYPGQEKELVLKDVYQQYNEVARYLSLIRKDITIVLSAGNHDALRLSEPQPLLNKIFAKNLYELDNVIMVNNPGMIKIHNMFDVLIYHGSSFDYYLNNIDFLRKAGSYDASDKMMEFILKKRHLTPTHISSMYIPDVEKDPLVINKIPDIFVTGHIHHDVKISSYKNITLIGCSSFQNRTAYQEKLGHTNVVPAKIPFMNLKTREIKIMDFRNQEDQDS